MLNIKKETAKSNIDDAKNILIQSNVEVKPFINDEEVEKVNSPINRNTIKKKTVNGQNMMMRGMKKELTFIKKNQQMSNIKEGQQLDEICIHYDPDKIPGDLNIAQQHQKAWQLGQEVEHKDDEVIQFCICCARQIERTVLPIQCDLRDLSFIGSGFPLYFNFIKFCCLILVILIISSGGFNLITNAYGEDCQDLPQFDTSSVGDCNLNWITMISLGNKKSRNDFMIIQQILNLLSILFIIVLLQILRRGQRLMNMQCDTLDIAAKDYTIVVKNIPKEFQAINNDYDEDIKNFFENNVLEKKIKVVYVNLCYNLSDSKKVQDQKEKVVKQKQMLITKLHQANKMCNSDQVIELQLQIDMLNDQLMQLEEELAKINKIFVEGKGTDIKKYFTGQAFVSFSNQQDKEEILKTYCFTFKDFVLKTKCPLIFHQHMIQVEQAAEPTCINWNNIQYTNINKLKRRTIGTLLSLMILLVCFSIILSLRQMQHAVKAAKSNPNTNTGDLQAVAFFISFVITCLNILLEVVIEKITKYEVYSEKISYTSKIAKNLAIAEFINTGLLTFIIEVAFPETGNKYGLMFSSGGLVYNQQYIFISNAVLTTIMSMMDISSVVKKYQQKVQIALGQESILTQKELNELFENPEIDLGERYASIIKTMFFTAFYSVILPVGLLWSLSGLIMIYWTDKFNLLRRRTVKINMSYEIAVDMVELIEFFLPIYSISNLLFYYYITGDDVPAAGIIGIIIGILHAILPMEIVNEKIFKLPEQEPNKVTYEESEMNFDTDYARENPATSDLAKEQFLQKMKHIKNKDSQNKLDVLDTQLIKEPPKISFQQENEILDGEPQLPEKVQQNEVSPQDTNFFVKNQNKFDEIDQIQEKKDFAIQVNISQSFNTGKGNQLDNEKQQQYQIIENLESCLKNNDNNQIEITIDNSVSNKLDCQQFLKNNFRRSLISRHGSFEVVKSPLLSPQQPDTQQLQKQQCPLPKQSKTTDKNYINYNDQLKIVQKVLVDQGTSTIDNQYQNGTEEQQIKQIINVNEQITHSMDQQFEIIEQNKKDNDETNNCENLKTIIKNIDNPQQEYLNWIYSSIVAQLSYSNSNVKMNQYLNKILVNNYLNWIYKSVNKQINKEIEYNQQDFQQIQKQIKVDDVQQQNFQQTIQQDQNSQFSDDSDKNKQQLIQYTQLQDKKIQYQFTDQQLQEYDSNDILQSKLIVHQVEHQNEYNYQSSSKQIVEQLDQTNKDDQQSQIEQQDLKMIQDQITTQILMEENKPSNQNNKIDAKDQINSHNLLEKQSVPLINNKKQNSEKQQNESEVCSNSQQNIKDSPDVNDKQTQQQIENSLNNNSLEAMIEELNLNSDKKSDEKNKQE